MRIELNNNAELIIQARDGKDYLNAMRVAQHMVSDNLTLTGKETISIASVDEHEHWIHLCAVWDNFQALELHDAYMTAKSEVMS